MSRADSASGTTFWNVERRTAALVSPAVFVVILFFAIPFGILAAQSFRAPTDSGLTLVHYSKILGDPLYRRIITTTITIAGIVTALTLVIGYPMALALVHIRTRWRRVLISFVALPLLLSGVIRTFGWIVLLAQNGAVNTIARELGLIEVPLRVLGTNLGVIIGLTHILLPFMVLAIVSNLSFLNPSLQEAAKGLGATPLRAFVRVTLPLSVPGVATGTLLVFIMASGAFVTPAMLGYGRVKVLPITVFEQTTTSINWGLASAAAITLLFIAATFLLVHRLVLRSQLGLRTRTAGAY